MAGLLLARLILVGLSAPPVGSQLDDGGGVVIVRQLDCAPADSNK